MLEFDAIFELIVAYKKEHGSCYAKKRYVTSDGVKLGNYISRLRGGTYKISDEERKRLDDIGFDWSSKNKRRTFEEIYSLLVAYKKKYGNCIVPSTAVFEDVRLGNYVRQIRSGKMKITEVQRKKLNDIGFCWKRMNYKKKLKFAEVYELITAYVLLHGNALIPSNYETPAGIKLGQIVSSIRSGVRRTTPEQKKKLNEIGFVWRVRKPGIKKSFEEIYELLKLYVNEYGDCLVPQNFIFHDEKLGIYVSRYRAAKERFSPEKRKLLDEIGFAWQLEHHNRRTSFEDFCEMLKKYKAEHGNCLVPNKYIIDDINLGNIVHCIRSGSRSVTPEQRNALDELGFVWRVKKSKKSQTQEIEKGEIAL